MSSTEPPNDPTTARWLLPECIQHPSRGWLRNMALGISAQGNITAIQPIETLPQNAPRELLHRRALLPGFVNAHSHAFQRAMRGFTERTHPTAPDDSFWAWRTRMYSIAHTLDPQKTYDIARALYTECLLSGYTAVGEFHYLHHKPDGSLYDPETAMSDALIQAAQDTGIRLTLLVGLYQTGGVNTPASSKQQRFLFRSFAHYTRFIEDLNTSTRDLPNISIGLAPHSIRAVPQTTLQELAAWNTERQLPIHIHASEQRSEVAQSLKAYGVSPIQALAQSGVLTQHTTVIHATHLEQGDASLLASTKARVCVCPTTEANLGDGWIPSETLVRNNVPMCIGSDSHIIVNPFEELRWIELEPRLQKGERNVLVRALQTSESTQQSIGNYLLRTGSYEGAQALGIHTGQLDPGYSADLLTIDLDSPLLQHTDPSALSDALVFGADPRCIQEVYVQGQRVAL